MPTASAFRQAAGLLRSHAGSATASSGTVQALRTDTGVLGGPYVAVVDRALSVSTLNLHRLSTEMESAANECDRRAVVCEQFTLAMARYRSMLYQWDAAYNAYWQAQYQGVAGYHPGPRPQPPMKPAPWVVEG